MNRSSRRAAANTSGLRQWARQLLHAFAEAGQPSPTALQLFIGPNGGLIWTESAQVDRLQPYAGDVFSSAEKSAARVDGQSPATISPQAAQIPVYTPLEAPVSN
jgi:hypothetical protein